MRFLMDSFFMIFFVVLGLIVGVFLVLKIYIIYNLYILYILCIYWLYLRNTLYTLVYTVSYELLMIERFYDDEAI